MIVTAPVLAYYDVSKPVVIQCDASQTGLGAALLQEGCPVAYSSRVMTPTEQNYAQIEKELLAIVFACEKFDQYIFGRSDVVVQSDHKPLEPYSRNPSTAPQSASNECDSVCRIMTSKWNTRKAVGNRIIA